MSIPLLDGGVAVVYPLVAGLATTLRPIGGAATTIVVGSAARCCRLLRRHPFHSDGHDLLPLLSASDKRPRTDLDDVTGAVQ